MTTGEERVFEAYYPPPLDGWYEIRAWPSPDGLSVYFVDITARRAADARARASAARLAVIADVTASLSRVLSPGQAEETALREVCRAVVPVLGDWVVATFTDEDGRVRDIASCHREPELAELVEAYAELRLSGLQPTAPLPRALATREPVVVDDVVSVVAPDLADGARDLFVQLAPRSGAVFPMVARGRTLGALSLYRGEGRDALDEEEIAAAREVADRTALALDNSRLYDQQRRLAEALQRSMLTAPPAPDHAEIVVRYHPALEVAQVGGDWYDAFLQSDGTTMLVIGDVVGHDTAAAAAMGQLRGLLRGIAFASGATPAAILSELDAAIRGLEMGTMATAAIARVEQTPEERAAGVTRLRWSNAGHPAPLLLHPDGRIEELGGTRPELMLGVDPSVRRTDSVVTFRRGSTVLLYTDGLIEGRKQLIDEGLALLREALVELADLPLQELCDRLIDRLRPGGLEDDVALVATRLHPQDRPRPPEAG
jgi:serine phosphatase RsbU (regulator of sigma subunit)